MNTKNLYLIALILFTSISGFAQNGKIKGIVFDDFNEPILGADILVVETDDRNVTDLEGKFSISIPEGTYTLKVTAPFMGDKEVKNIEVLSGKTTDVTVVMGDDSEIINSIVDVVAYRVDNTTGATDKERNRSDKVTDIVSQETMEKSGVTNAVGAVSKAPGVTIQGGKYVFVRGLGDRYTKTILNGLDIPGLDPDRNAMQLDVFPTTVIKNIVIYKTFTPDLPGDFVGGLVDVITQDFPSEKKFKVSTGLGFRAGTTFNKDNIGQNGSTADIIGLGGGSRSLPFSGVTVVPSRIHNHQSLNDLTSKFSSNMAAQSSANFLNTNFSVSGGNSFLSKNEKIKYGFNAGVSYRNQHTFYESATFSRFTKDPDSGTDELFEQERAVGKQAVNNILWTGLLSGGLRFENAKYNLTLLHTQNGQSTTTERTRNNFDQTGAVLIEDILAYTQRSVSNAGLLMEWGDEEKLKIQSKSSFTLSRLMDPDFRTSTFSIADGDTTLKIGDGAGINRFWRDLTELNFVSQLNFTYPFKMAQTRDAKLKFGGSFGSKAREFNTYQYNFFATQGVAAQGDPNFYFQPENIWTPGTNGAQGEGVYVVGNYEPANNYYARQNLFAGYAMGDLPLSKKLKSVIGARVEGNQMFYTGTNNSGDTYYKDEQTLNAINVLPSANFIYSLVQDTMNLRISANQTLARPSFKEKSIAEIYDPISRRTFVGNIGLEQTSIWNFDVRWEYFFAPGQIISTSAFYKQFDGHIEMVSFEVAPDNLTPKNAGRSSNFGAEIELRTNLGFISDTVNTWALQTNFTYVQSRLDMTQITVDDFGRTEYESRVDNARDQETVGKFRPMSGQAPYNVNFALNYAREKSGINANLSYNVQGRSLAIVGVGSVPDVYVSPFHSLNLKVSKAISDVTTIAFKANNILNDNNEMLYIGHNNAQGIFSDLLPGRSFSITASFNLAKINKAEEME